MKTLEDILPSIKQKTPDLYKDYDFYIKSGEHKKGISFQNYNSESKENLESYEFYSVFDLLDNNLIYSDDFVKLKKRNYNDMAASVRHDEYGETEEDFMNTLKEVTRNSRTFGISLAGHNIEILFAKLVGKYTDNLLYRINMERDSLFSDCFSIKKIERSAYFLSHSMRMRDMNNFNSYDARNHLRDGLIDDSIVDTDNLKNNIISYERVGSTHLVDYFDSLNIIKLSKEYPNIDFFIDISSIYHHIKDYNFLVKNGKFCKVNFINRNNSALDVFLQWFAIKKLFV